MATGAGMLWWPVQQGFFRAVMIKTRRKAAVIVAILTAVLALAVIIAGGALRKIPEKALLKVLSERVDLEVKNVHYTEVGDSGMKWEIMADSARYQKKENLAVFDKVTVRLVMKDGRVFLMTGDRGRLNTASRDIEIEGDVRIVSENGDRFTTERIRYINNGKLIETDQPVVMENRGARISGVGMVFSLEGKKVSLLSQVRASSGGK